MSRSRTALVAAAVAAVVLVAVMTVAPRLAGGLAYVRATGVSMRPSIVAGDLALVRAEGRYRVGDVVAYRSDTLDVVVLHRVVAVTPQGLSTKGDNNTWLDPDTPEADEVIGRMWLLVPHGASLLPWMTVPGLLGLGGLVWLLRRSFGPGTSGRHGTRRPRRRTPDADQRAPAPPPPAAAYQVLPAPSRASHALTERAPARRVPAQRVPAQRVPARRVPTERAPAERRGRLSAVSPAAPAFATTTGCLAVFAAAALGLGFAGPLQTPTTRNVRYDVEFGFDYGADAPRGAAYPDGRVHFGDPVFRKLVGPLRVDVTSRLPNAEVSGPGTLRLTAVLAAAGGWRAPVTPEVVVPMSGQGTASLTVDLRGAARLLDDVRTATGVSLGGVTLTVQAQARVPALVAGQAILAGGDAALTFTADDVQLLLSRSGRTVTEPRTVPVPVNRPRWVNLLGFRLQAAWLRALGVPAAALAAAGGLILLVARRRPPDLARRLQRRYPQRLVRVHDVDDGLPVVEIASVEDLFRLADQTGEFVLHDVAPGHEGFLLEHGATRYRYSLADRR